MKPPKLVFSALPLLLVALFIISVPAGARVLTRPLFASGAPQVVSYQGQVTVDGGAYNGAGFFKFAVVNAAGDTTYWANDGTAVGEPVNAVQLSVVNGLFNVLLGDTAIPNMTALSAAAFDGTERYLRVWFSSDGSTFTLLSPDTRVTAVPYALQAEEAKTAATAGDADTLDGYHASAFQQRYANVVIVAKSGGDYATITAALNSITDADDANRYLVRIMPGVYTEQVTMKQYVDIEGSGELTTKITYTGSVNINNGTVIGANDAELRFLTVVNTGGSDYAAAIYNASASPRLTHVTATASGSLYNGGVYNDANAAPLMTHVTVSASGTGEQYNVGVFNEDNAAPTLIDATISASGGSFAIAVYNNNASATLQHCTLQASGGTGSYGIYNETYTGSYTVRVDNSQVTGSTNAIFNSANFATLIGATLLDGGTDATSGGTITCAGVYDEAYTFYASACP
ncbi:MAG: hypothetical protein KC415_10610 [Anaerolineales bacterium]|nr:hypothetical protein [Anaerolineales bacterium]